MMTASLFTNMMVIDNKYEIGQTVFLKTDEDQMMRIVGAIIVCPTGLLYELACGKDNSRHYDFEISETEDLVLKSK